MPIAPDKSASIRVATNCGYKEILQTVYKGEPTIISVATDYDHVRPSFLTYTAHGVE
jgi:hypothetical protein